MQAVILTAGRGTRMKNLTENSNKNMLEVKGKPILEYKLDALPDEIDEIIFVVGYFKGQIENHFGNNYKGKKIKYVIQEELNGTGGAVHRAKDLIKDKFLVMYGDDLYEKSDLEELIKYDLAVLGYEVENIGRFGVIKTDEKGNMIEILEAPHKTNEFRLANMGVYILNEKFFDYKLVPSKPGSGEYGLPQTMENMAKDYEIKVVKAEYWHPIGNPDDIESAEKVLHKFLK